MIRDFIEGYAYLPVSFLISFLAYRYLGTSINITASICLSCMFFSLSLFRPRLRKEDPRRYIAGLVGGVSLSVFTILVYFKIIEAKPVWAFLALSLIYIVDYFMAKKFYDMYDHDS